ncbi:hypothetical protein [Roseiconus lacunae]|uniref:DUF4760 domain-containing protein n=1 Tax=Roseiconus lacunae TaxID=2605694 RepID=A0ABT7PG59_9BACT|nr:hypothetical protein [Roseiconus lacunae]MDM4015289.1 hypothetical protein [Roseiconus lacunae]
MNEQQIFKWVAAGIGITITILVFPVLLWAILYLLTVPSSTPLAFPTSLNELGDSFGFVNAIVSALAFAAIVVSLYYQRTDLATNQRHLEATLEEMAQTSESTKELAASQRSTNELAAYEQWRSLSESLTEREEKWKEGGTYEPSRAIRWFQSHLAILQDCRRMRKASGREPSDDVVETSLLLEALMAEMLLLWGRIEDANLAKQEVSAEHWERINHCGAGIRSAINSNISDTPKIDDRNLRKVASYLVLQCSTWLMTICQQGQKPIWPKPAPRKKRKRMRLSEYQQDADYRS